MSYAITVLGIDAAAGKVLSVHEIGLFLALIHPIRLPGRCTAQASVADRFSKKMKVVSRI